MDQPYGSPSSGRTPRGAWEGWEGSHCRDAGRVDAEGVWKAAFPGGRGWCAFAEAEGLSAPPVGSLLLPLTRFAVRLARAPGAAPAHGAATPGPPELGRVAFPCAGHCVPGLQSPDER